MLSYTKDAELFTTNNLQKSEGKMNKWQKLFT